MISRLCSITVFLKLLDFGVLFYGPSLAAQTEPVDAYADSLKNAQAYYWNNDKIDSGFVANAALIRYFKKIGNDYEYVRESVNRAEVLRAIGGYTEAINTIREVEPICKTLPLSTVKSSFYNRKGAILHEMRQHEAALAAIKESQRIDSIKGFKWRIISNLLLEGALYRDMNDLEKAEKVLAKTFVASKDLADSSDWASAAYNLTVLNFRLGNYERSIRYGRRYIDITPFKEQKITYGDVFHLVSRAYEELGNIDSAHFYLDSVYGIRMRHMQRIIDDNSSKYEVVNQLEKERLENDILQAEREQSRLQLIILALAVLVAIVLIYFANRQRNQYKRANAQQEEYSKELENSLIFKNKLISIVAHDIRNPIASLKGLIHVYNEGLVEEKDLEQMMRGLEASVGNVDLLLENLLNFVRSQSGELDPHIERLNVAEVVHVAISEAQAQLQDKGISVNLDKLNAQDTISTDGNYLAFVLRNVLSNAIKFSEPNSSIEISCHHEEDFDCIDIQDFGKGMNAETLKQIRENSAIRSNLGTGNEKGTGLGIGLSQEFLHKINGKLKIESSLGEGTTVSICLPKS